MNCLNGERFVRQAIDSVYAQTYKNWEIVFLDNASTDATPEIAKSYDPRLRYYRNPVTVPLGRARNLALERASGEFIAFLDADDLWLPHKLEKQMPLFEASPSLGLVFSDAIMRFDGQSSTTTYFRRYNYKPPRGKIFGALLTQYSIPMLTAVVRAELLHRLGHRFDDRYQACDDFDFFLQLAYECECDYVDEPLASCLLHPEGTWSRLQGLGPNEMRMTLDKLRTAHPDLDTQFGGQMERMYRDVARKEAISCWCEGHDSRAREALRPYRHEIKSLVLYCATFLPSVGRRRLYWFVRRCLYRATMLLHR